MRGSIGGTYQRGRSRGALRRRARPRPTSPSSPSGGRGHGPPRAGGPRRRRWPAVVEVDRAPAGAGSGVGRSPETQTPSPRGYEAPGRLGQMGFSAGPTGAGPGARASRICGRRPLSRDQATSHRECGKDLGRRPQARRARWRGLARARGQGPSGIEAEVALGHGFDRQPFSAAGERERVDQPRMAEQVGHLAAPALG